MSSIMRVRSFLPLLCWQRRLVQNRTMQRATDTPVRNKAPVRALPGPLCRTTLVARCLEAAWLGSDMERLQTFTRMMSPMMDAWALRYQAQVGKDLKKYGLRVDDLIDQDYHPNIEEAIRRLPQEVQDARLQRLKRAIDLSGKHSGLPDDLRAQQTPFEPYLQDSLARVEAEEAERAELGSGGSYQRQIP